MTRDNATYQTSPRTRVSRLQAVAVAVALVALSGGAAGRDDSGGESSRFTEYEVKAAFINNFARFVEWPDSAFSDAAGPVVIGILGDDPFGQTFDIIVSGKHAQGRPIRVTRYAGRADIDTCHILFISASEEHNLDAILQDVGRRPVLTVGDTERYARRGCIANLFLEGERVRFRVNVDAVERSGLMISARLLRLAHIVHDPVIDASKE